MEIIERKEALEAGLIRYFTGEFCESMATGKRFMYNPKTGDARISGSLASLAGLEKALELNNQYEIEFYTLKRLSFCLLLYSQI